ncbi:MAG TPA: hypothetical protein VHE83_00620 [Mycobacteriales bacterium]|nr:hypothetical protein [Mycobacteriales bacterium]
MPTPTQRATRDISALVMGNEKLAEVVLALVAENGSATAQQIAVRLTVNHDLARSPLQKLVRAGVLTELPRRGGPRSELFYEVIDSPLWRALVALAVAVQGHAASRVSPAGTP